MKLEPMKTRGYVPAVESCSTMGTPRAEIAQAGDSSVPPTYSSVENEVEIGVLDGFSGIRSFLQQLPLCLGSDKN